MSIKPPPSNWFQAPSGNERLWIGLALMWCLIMFVMMPFWHLRGQQNSTGEAYAISPRDFQAQVEQFVERNQVGSEGHDPIVEPPPGGDAYLLARMWSWYPILQLQAGETYRLHISSLDIQHGFSLLPMNMNFQIIPGYDHVLTITPQAPGEYTIVCNEFCGIDHHRMIGKIIVK